MYTRLCNEIPLKDATPVTKKPYPIPLKHIKAVKDEIIKLQEMNIIRPSTSNYASPAFLIPKKNGEMRLVIDYRELNQKTIKLGYPFPNMHNLLGNLTENTIYTILDLNLGYYQFRMDEESIDKTAFVTPFGQYEFLRMPFGLCNAPREFQCGMNQILGHLPYVTIFLDDIL